MSAFTSPKVISPFIKSRGNRIPRKLKKRLKKSYPTIMGYDFVTLPQKLWRIQGIENPNYNRFLINKVIEHDRNRRL